MKMNPPLIYQLFMLCMLALFFLLPETRVIPFPISLLGIPVFIFGVSMAVSAKKIFQASDTPLSPTATPGKLHREGYFKITRNPMYLGITIGLLGFALLLNSYLNFIFPLLFMFLVDRFFIQAEEKLLSQVFGDEYLQYKQNVRRWI